MKRLLKSIALLLVAAACAQGVLAQFAAPRPLPGTGGDAAMLKKEAKEEKKAAKESKKPSGSDMKKSAKGSTGMDGGGTVDVVAPTTRPVKGPKFGDLGGGIAQCEGKCKAMIGDTCYDTCEVNFMDAMKK